MILPSVINDPRLTLKLYQSHSVYLPILGKLQLSIPHHNYALRLQLPSHLSDR